jgi:energy-coupling factor transporter ATP-binding protein EcfA2/5S rRNA maturation endonuclease (ribonuclease M5)
MLLGYTPMGSPTRLLRFRVRAFRSIQDSGWINVDSVSAMIGVNESGKTNLLLPLWKLKPARDGEIDIIADAPRKKFTEIRANPQKFTFIEAVFELSDEAAEQIAEMAKVDTDAVRTVEASRRFDGSTYIRFPDEPGSKSIASSEITSVLKEALETLSLAVPSGKGDEIFHAQAREQVEAALQSVGQEERVSLAGFENVGKALASLDLQTAPAKSTAKPVFVTLHSKIACLSEKLNAPTAGSVGEVRTAALKLLPSFIYYSTYGNLDSEIYLPHVIENLARTDLRGKEAAKARTLRVLFDFVGLKPAEILELGEEKPPSPQTGVKSEAVIEGEARKKKEREVLLQSASTLLTTRFKDWWKQGTYRFRLQADGKHFRIWVSDDRRVDEIELEGRSTGLQWFLSFYLVFLVEKRNDHQDCILLLDEPGHSLHPLAQKDLIAFFHSLSEDGQIIYTTHSPFLVDSDRLDDVLAVYVDANGHTQASTDLRVNEIQSDRDRSIYPVHAAVGLSVSDVLLQGCDVVVVEGPSDQIYLSIIKLSRSKAASSKRELVFVPAKGTRSIKALTAILSGTQKELPVVLLDSDAEGLETAKQLKKDLYAASPGRVLTLEDCGFGVGREVEDVMPRESVLDAVSREFKHIETELEEVDDPSKPIVDQIEIWAAANSLDLPRGWKVAIARRVRQRFENGSVEAHSSWEGLFDKIDKARVS